MTTQQRPPPRPNREVLTLGLLSLLLAAACIAIAIGFWAPIMWAIILSLIFQPVYDRLTQHMRPAWASTLTVLLILLSLVLPALVVASMIAGEVTQLLATVQKLDPQEVLRQGTALFDNLPQWLKDMLDRAGISRAQDIDDYALRQVQTNIRLIGTQLLSFGQTMFTTGLSILMMLYLCFFFLMTGERLVAKGGALLPLSGRTRVYLGQRIAAVMRSTVKGSILVAIMQGIIGGIIFALLGIGSPVLWGAVMGFAALLPAVGTGLVWVPAAIFLLATGQTWQGVALILAGVFVISASDNLVRPMIVGRDTGMPDWVVLVMTLGGVGLLGFHGLVFGPLVAGVAIAVWELYGRKLEQGESAI